MILPSVEDLIFDAAVKLLQQITKANGFNRDIANVYDELVPIDQVENKPDSIVIEFGDDHYRNSDSGGFTTGLFEMQVPLFIHCFLHATEKARVIQNQMKADIERLFFRDRVGNTLNGTCQQVMLANVVRWGTKIEKPNCGISAELIVWYRQKITNPTQKGQ